MYVTRPLHIVSHLPTQRTTCRWVGDPESEANNVHTIFTLYMFRTIWEFAQSRDCVAHSQNPEIVFQSRDYAL